MRFKSGYWLQLVSCILALFEFRVSVGYRLNVPRVLLPYHPTQQIQFVLEISHPDGGCFNWRSSRENIVSIAPINPRTNGCSDKALITSKSKHANEESAVIFAENQDEGVSFLCDVTVDVINKIDITTTTKVLFMDAAPARMIVEAINAEGDRFSTLGNIPFEWRFSNLSEKSLRIVPFSQSNYDAPPGIEELEKQKKQGFIVLVEGLLTGSAVLTANFAEKQYEHIQPSGIELFAVANVMLVPSQDLYLPVYAMVPYKAMVIRKDKNEEITLPSPHYSIEVTDPSVCEFDVKDSRVTAISLGSTEITLIDSTGVEKLKGIVKPRSAHLYVVEPAKIRFSIVGNNWYLQKNAIYKITIQLLDSADNVIYIPENAIFAVKMPSLFRVLQKSPDNTDFEVKAIDVGDGVIKSGFESLITKAGRVLKAQPVVLGEQQIVVSNPINVVPEVLLFPYHGGKKDYEYKLKASGGTGRYKWSSSGESVARVDQNNGLVRTSNSLGECSVTASDLANLEHQDSTKVFVVDPYSLHFGPSNVDAVVGSKIVLNLKMSGQTSQGLLPFTDCRHVPFKFEVGDENVFTVDESAQTNLPPAGAGCATVSVIARSPGETRLTATFNRLQAQIDITSTVDLTGIRIVTSTANAETGSLVSAHIQGITKDGEFSFDDAIYPFDVYWKLSGSDVAVLKSPLADFIDESPRNRFSVNIQTLNRGQTTLHATVKIDSSLTRNFYGKARKFSGSTPIFVEDSLRLANPPLSTETIRMGPRSSLELSVSRSNARISVPSHFASLLSVNQMGNVNVLQSLSKEGNGIIEIHDVSTNKSTLVHVEVLPVQSIHLRSEMPEDLSANFGVNFLPKHSKIRFSVEFRDALGRLMHSASNQISYRFHRTDVIETTPSKDNRNFEAQLKQPGDTVFKVWDTNDKRISTFLRISIGEPYASTPSPAKQKPKLEIVPQVKQEIKKAPGMPEIHADHKEPKPSIKDMLGNFFDRYNNFVLSVFVVILATMLVVGGIRLGGFNEPQGPYVGARTPTHISEISSIHEGSRSSLQDARTGRYLSTDRPLFHSTPGAGNTPTPVFGDGDAGLQYQLRSRHPAQVRNMGRDRQEEEQSSIRNVSSNSAGSAEDPYRWTTNDANSAALVNRHYK
ncbi:nuclear pore membrane glycoprotein-like [Ditylenchus destructor]|nr:nuclear pore membrane glycoprotein-like [Ditylenchus destructor]